MQRNYYKYNNYKHNNYIMAHQNNQPNPFVIGKYVSDEFFHDILKRQAVADRLRQNHLPFG